MPRRAFARFSFLTKRRFPSDIHPLQRSNDFLRNRNREQSISGRAVIRLSVSNVRVTPTMFPSTDPEGCDYRPAPDRSVLRFVTFRKNSFELSTLRRDLPGQDSHHDTSAFSALPQVRYPKLGPRGCGCRLSPSLKARLRCYRVALDSFRYLLFPREGGFRSAQNLGFRVASVAFQRPLSEESIALFLSRFRYFALPPTSFDVFSPEGGE